MATTIPACMALLNVGTAVNNCHAWDALPPKPAISAASRATVITAILAGTVATEADVLALIATAATGGVTQKQVWDLMTLNAATVG